jgi:hypothetical protein
MITKLQTPCPVEIQNDQTKKEKKTYSQIKVKRSISIIFLIRKIGFTRKSYLSLSNETVREK